VTDPNKTAKPAAESLERLIAIMHRLRAPGGCPWDAEQTHASIRMYAVEEAFEVVEAIESGTDDDLRDELGDLLLQVVFHAEMAAERGAFAVGDVAEAICAKLVRRHPHVFADVRVGSADDVVVNWSRIKAEEKRERANDAPTSVLDGLPRGLPALLRAHRIGQKAGSVGFDWEGWRGVRAKLDEEIRELDRALETGDEAAVSEELGDVLLTVASLARHRDRNAEEVLRAAIDRFESRFRNVESRLQAAGRSVDSASAAELDEAWEQAKRELAADTRR